MSLSALRDLASGVLLVSVLFLTTRAIAVLRYLAETGIVEPRLRAIGYADTQPWKAMTRGQERDNER